MTIVTDLSVVQTPQQEKTPPKIPQVTEYKYQATEGRLRQNEGKTSIPQLVPISEGRIRMQERQYSASLEANLTKISPKQSPKRSPRDNISASVANKINIDYDESKNPFAESSTNPFYEKSTNPFDEDDDEDYDKNSNRFAA